MKLNLLVLRAQDPHRLAQFYGHLGLDFQREQHGNGPEHMACSMAQSTIEIYPSQGATTTGTRIGFSVSDVEEAVHLALGANGTMRTAPRRGQWGMRAVIEDPEGHIVELTEQVA